MTMSKVKDPEESEVVNKPIFLSKLKSKINLKKVRFPSFKLPKFKLWYLLIALGFIGFGVIGIASYFYFSDPVIRIDTQLGISDDEVNVSINDQKIPVSSGKIKLSKDQLGKEIKISHPDYQEANVTYQKNLTNLINPSIKLKPVEYSTIEINLRFDKQDITTGQDKVTLSSNQLNVVGEKFNGSLRLENQEIKEYELVVDIPNFTKIQNTIKPHFGRNKYNLNLEYNRHSLLKVKNLLTNEAVTDVQVKEVNSKTNQNGELELNHLENYQSIELSKDGFNTQTIKIEDTLPTNIELTPTGRIAYPKAVDRTNMDLYSANYDGTDEKKIADKVKRGFQHGNDFWFIQGQFGYGVNLEIFKADLSTGQATKLEGFKDNNFDVKSRTITEISPFLESNSVVTFEYDGGGFSPSFNKTTVKKISENNPVVVRNRKFPPNVSENLRSFELSPDGSLAGYSIESWDYNKTPKPPYKATHILKVVKIDTGDVLLDQGNFDEKLYPAVETFTPNNRFLIYSQYPTGTYKYRSFFAYDLQSKTSFELNSNSILKNLHFDSSSLVIIRKNTNETKFVEINLETKEEKILFTGTNIKNWLVLDNKLYIRQNEQWNILVKEILKPVNIKPKFVMFYNFWSRYYSDPMEGWDLTPEQQELLR